MTGFKDGSARVCFRSEKVQKGAERSKKVGKGWKILRKYDRRQGNKRFQYMSDLIGKAHDRRAETYDKLFQNNFFTVYDFITRKYLEPRLPRNTDAVVLDAASSAASTLRT